MDDKFNGSLAAKEKQTDGFSRDNQRFLYPTVGPITKENRLKRNGHKSHILWFTGLSGAGKTTIARRLEERLFQQGSQVYVLDGDNIRTGLNKDLSFSAKDRSENIRRIAEVAKLFVDAGMIVITAFISPYSEDRCKAKAIFGEGEFTEVYIKCPFAVCEQRDVKGLYKKARNKEVKYFTGIDDQYEEPQQPDIILETNIMTVEECVDKIMGYFVD